ncbi:double-strand break repair helicase AddA [Amorphus orientalis]|uniref:DNA 3'-5' helicase n=1 Tax=Amorphus orientalis TaxID=649198 RepID=A0AAE3VQ21_9HYPH|nr:double-strand break repair helicase AddA [Amorphus orientalis]MDQ0316749.1 ATP-dependent helicase/nuclease subunit A [Amorphus orientalis]
MTRREIPEATQVAQARAAAPGASAWVSANAGSGKTHVLVERVVNLLLSGVAPGRILCLTFTNAAAAQMSQRVFDRLAAFARADDAALDTLLEGRLDGPAGPDDRTRARRLFAAALETPGGLKIQTIHAFCAMLLHQFPLEANLAARFTVLDDTAANELVDAAIAQTLAEAAADPQGPLADAIAAILPLSADLTLIQSIRAMVTEREAFRLWIRHAGDLEDAIGDLKAALGLDPSDTPDSLADEMLASPHFDDGFRSAYAGALARGGANDIKQADRIAIAADPMRDPAERAEAWLDIFLTAKREPRSDKGAGSKGVRSALPDLDDRFAAEQARLIALLDKARAHRAVSATAALARLADRVIALVEAEKAREGFVDYDDQIARTAALLSRSEAADWIQYKLDQGIDHILVDEAQDTSPRQWEIVNALAREFFAGKGARSGPRTVFAVGDEKQSIYGFQGAAPATFGEQLRHFRSLAERAESTFNAVRLTLSFRSTPDVLGAVDAVFADPNLHRRIESAGEGLVHEPIRANDPGKVTLWPLTETQDSTIPDDWTLPLDHEAAASGEWQLAERIAATIRGWLDSGARRPNGARIKAGDVLILVRKRKPFADVVIRSLKAAGVPVAGADRLTVTEHIAIEDLIALGRFLLTPADDLSLAAVLKSPLFGLSEEELYRLASGREGTLEAALFARRDDPVLAAVAERIARWRRIALSGRPFDLFATVLGADDGRRLFRSRLGTEVDDVLDAFLDLALDYEHTGIPTLEGFLTRVTASASELKRESDTAPEAVRVMTVHGAKGLEAPIVFLADGCAAPVHGSHARKIVPLPPISHPNAARPLVWAPNPDHKPSRVADVIEAEQASQKDEYARLLYVAMTRAEDQLIVCGWSPKRGPHEECWYRLIETGLAPDLVDVTDDEANVVAREWHGVRTERTAPPEQDEPAAARTRTPLPDWARTPAPPPVVRAPALSPSGALPHDAGSVRRAGETDRADPSMDPETVRRTALLRGDLTHRLLELLPDAPPDERPAAGRRILAVHPGAQSLDGEAIIASVLAILDDPQFAPVFGPGSRPEVAVAGRLPIGGVERLVTGRIDRMVQAGGRVLIVDFKSDRPAPATVDDVPQSYIAQLALYRDVLRPLVGDAALEAALVWTDSGRLMKVPPADLDRARAAVDAQAAEEPGGFPVA